MIKAKDYLRRLVPSMVTCLGLGLCMLGAGCSSLSGFRSVGAERPSLLNFWDRPAGTPTPENDSYVQSMRAGQERAARDCQGAMAKRVRAERTAWPTPAKSLRTIRMRCADAGVRPRSLRLVGTDNTVRVSLGRPEPLPGAGLALGVDGQAGVDGRQVVAVEGRQ